MTKTLGAEQKYTIGRQGVKIPEFTGEAYPGFDRYDIRRGHALWKFFHTFWELNGQPLPEDKENPWKGEYIVHGSTERPLVIVRGERSKQHDEVGSVNHLGETFAECATYMSEEHSVLMAPLGEAALSNLLTAYVDTDHRRVTQIFEGTKPVAHLVVVDALGELQRTVGRVQDLLK